MTAIADHINERPIRARPYVQAPLPRHLRQSTAGPQMEARHLVRAQIASWKVQGVRAEEVAESIGCVARWSAIEKKLRRWWVRRRMRA